MVSILIVDDEEDIIALVKKLIEYPEVRIVGEAKNGEDAYAQIMEKKPDLVITDISMPGMSGMELIERVKMNCPETSFVVISGYRDFEYAQSALRFEVSDYLLKPIKKAELNNILEKVDKRLQRKNQLLEEADLLQKNIDESKGMIRKNFVQQMLHSLNGELLEIPQIKGKPVFDFGRGGFSCLLLKLDEGYLTQADEKSLQALLQDAGEALRKSAEPYCREVEFILSDNRVYFLLNFQEDKTEEEIGCFYKNCEKLLKDINYKFGFIRMTAGVGRTVGSRGQLRAAYKQAEYAIHGRLENSKSFLLLFETEQEASFKKDFRFKEWAAERRLGAVIERVDEKEIEEAFGACWEEFVVKKRIPGASYEVGKQFVDLLHRTLQGMSGLEVASCPEYDKVYRQMDNCYDAKRMREIVIRYIRTFIVWCRESAKDGEDRSIRRAKNFVEEHYAETITLEDVARYVCLSPTYFSSLFKAQTGQGFLSYLQSVRILQAKKLLRESNANVSQISRMVGYADAKYFTKLFVKETGIKPSVYRKFYS